MNIVNTPVLKMTLPDFLINFRLFYHKKEIEEYQPLNNSHSRPYNHHGSRFDYYFIFKKQVFNIQKKSIE